MVSPVPAAVALARLTEEERGWVGALRVGLATLLGERLVDLRLFGSKVRGDIHDESDIDILVLVEALDSVTARAISDMAHALSPWLALSVFDAERYHAPASRATGFYRELRRESVRLWHPESRNWPATSSRRPTTRCGVARLVEVESQGEVEVDPPPDR